jgi:hypothetical protein
MKNFLTYIPTRIKELNQEIDDMLWEDTADPRIEQLVEELNYLKSQEKKGELYEPDF